MAELTMLTEDQLAELRGKLDRQMGELRTKKLAIQQEIDRRRAAERPLPGQTISNAGNIESGEDVGGLA